MDGRKSGLEKLWNEVCFTNVFMVVGLKSHGTEGLYGDHKRLTEWESNHTAVTTTDIGSDFTWWSQLICANCSSGK